MEHLGATIRALRLERGISQADLADAAGIRQQTLYRHELGIPVKVKGRKRRDRRFVSPKTDTLIRIAAALDVPLEKLLSGHGRTVAHGGRRVKRA